MRIGELATASGTTTKTLRFYEATGLLPAPDRSGNGYRDYAPDSLARLQFIRRSRTAGLTLAQVRGILEIRDAGDSPCQHVRGLLGRHLQAIDRQIDDLQALRSTVAPLHAAAAAVDPANCSPADVCRYV